MGHDELLGWVITLVCLAIWLLFIDYRQSRFMERMFQHRASLVLEIVRLRQLLRQHGIDANEEVRSENALSEVSEGSAADRPPAEGPAGGSSRSHPG